MIAGCCPCYTCSYVHTARHDSARVQHANCFCNGCPAHPRLASNIYPTTASLYRCLVRRRRRWLQLLRPWRATCVPPGPPEVDVLWAGLAALRGLCGFLHLLSKRCMYGCVKYQISIRSKYYDGCFGNRVFSSLEFHPNKFLKWIFTDIRYYLAVGIRAQGGNPLCLNRLRTSTHWSMTS